MLHNQTPENFSNESKTDKVSQGPIPKVKDSSKKFDLIRKLAGPVVLATSALSMNATAQSAPNSQDILREAEQLGNQAQVEAKRAAALLTMQGILLKIGGNLEEAKKTFNKALELDPTNKEAKESLSEIEKKTI